LPRIKIARGLLLAIQRLQRLPAKDGTSAFPVDDLSNLTRGWIDKDIAIVKVSTAETENKVIGGWTEEWLMRI
jgi:hypothetical protein